MREGKNREVKKVLRESRPPGQPADPHRVRAVQLGDLPRGGVEEVNPRVLRDQLGGRLPSQG